MLPRITRTKDHSRLLKNFFSLSSIQAANYLLPLITFPYLLRILGPERFGLVKLAQAVAVFLIILTDYGFHFTATRTVAIHHHDREKVSEIASSILYIKVFLLVLAFLLLGGSVYLIPHFRVESALFLTSFALVVGQTFYFSWLLQGLERMSYLTLVYLPFRIAYVVSIFIFVRRADDYLYVNLLNGLSLCGIALTIGLIVMLRFHVRPARPRWSMIRLQLREGWPLFISMVFTSGYVNSNIVVLGFFGTAVAVGYYAAAHTLVEAVLGLLRVTSEAIYPHLCRLAGQSRESALHFLRKLLPLVGSAGLVLSLALFVSPRFITIFVLSQKFEPSEWLLRLMSPLPFVVGLGIVSGVQTLLTFGLRRQYATIMISGCLLHLVLVSLAAWKFGAAGVAGAWVITETYVTLARFYATSKNGLAFWKRPEGASCRRF